MVTHELRSPLHIINNHLDVVLSGEIGDPLTPEQAKLVRRARAASERQTALVDDLLLISRRDAGQFSLNLKDLEISHVIAETAQELEVVAEDSGVRLTVEVPPMLPLVRADGIRIAQVVRNLLTNAIKFTPSGGSVAVSVEPTPDRLLIHVRDTGIGIAPQHLDHIFDRFFQVGGTAPHGRAHGQGLGLAIVRIIVESHGGTIQVRSAPGRGSSFTVSLPLAPSTSLPGAD
jgi:signal transduction histidine kinase